VRQKWSRKARTDAPNRFVSTTKNSTKCVVNWIPLRIRVCSRNTQLHLRPVAGSINESLSQTHISKSEFKNEILRSALLDIQVTLLCVCGVDSFISELKHLIKKPFHGLFSKKMPLKSDSWIQIHELKLRSTSSAKINFAEEITWIT